MSTTNLAVRTRLPKKIEGNQQSRRRCSMKFKTGEKTMFEAQAPNAERIETILSTSDFFRATSTRRTLVQRILASGRSVVVGGAVGVAGLSRDIKRASAD